MPWAVWSCSVMWISYFLLPWSSTAQGRTVSSHLSPDRCTSHKAITCVTLQQSCPGVSPVKEHSGRATLGLYMSTECRELHWGPSSTTGVVSMVYWATAASVFLQTPPFLLLHWDCKLCRTRKMFPWVFTQQPGSIEAGPGAPRSTENCYLTKLSSTCWGQWFTVCKGGSARVHSSELTSHRAITSCAGPWLDQECRQQTVSSSITK